YTAFQCRGWLCDEDNAVHPLISRGLDYGRRAVLFDGDRARRMIATAAGFLLRQLKKDGSFIYGISPRFDAELRSYNILRHAGTLWALCLRCRMEPSPELKAGIERGLKYLLSQLVYKDKDTAYIWEDKSGEIKLGGCGLTVLALTEYMDVMSSDQYRDVCRALGNGILRLMDEKGAYVHVLNRNFSLKAPYRTVFYDGEATFALTRLYRLTGERRWLDAACRAVEHFIAADYVRYKDHWIAYTMDELTKYVNKPEYWAFALRNAQANLRALVQQDTTSHIYLELLMATFEVYDRLSTQGVTVQGFDLKALLKAIRTRADRQLNGYFFPEFAMYMANPRRIVNSFMVRQNGYRVRIDDVQHNIGGYYLYQKYYDKLVRYGMPVR
ncbi:MAG: hypothetical protein IJ702_09065, partial [Fretibacterium sp.]|nr:hypothetical protein [Fretibacterium sp.]